MLASGMSMTAFVGQWKQDTIGWWYQNDDGSYFNNGWEWIDSYGDGTAECYYFDTNGYMLANTTTPDGNQVNENGAWIELGLARTKAMTGTTPIQSNAEAENAARYGEKEVQKEAGDYNMLYEKANFMMLGSKAPL